MAENNIENVEINVKLTVAEANVILGHLGQGAFATVADLITKIKTQAQEQLSGLDKPADKAE